MNEQTERLAVKTKRSVQEALDELEREFNVRARCFPRWIQDGRVSRTDAQDRLDRLGSAIEWITEHISAPATCKSELDSGGAGTVPCNAG
jgi:hypothetical protein